MDKQSLDIQEFERIVKQIVPRQPFDDDDPTNPYMESDRDFLGEGNNWESAIWLMENAEILLSIIKSQANENPTYEQLIAPRWY